MRYTWIDDYLLAKRGVTKDHKKEWNWIRYQIGGKLFAAVCLNEEDEPYYITLKLEPEEGDFLRKQYEDIVPGYYMNKVHWNSVRPDGAVPDDLLKDLLDKSYQLVLGGLSKRSSRRSWIRCGSRAGSDTVTGDIAGCREGGYRIMSVVCLGIEVIGIGTIIFALMLLLRGDGSREQKLMQYFLIGSLVQNVGYLLELTAPTPEAALVAVKFQYLGSLTIPVSYCYFIFSYCCEKTPKSVLRVLKAVDVLILVLVFTCDLHKLYYRNIEWVENVNRYGGYLRMDYEWGIGSLCCAGRRFRMSCPCMP